MSLHIKAKKRKDSSDFWLHVVFCVVPDQHHWPISVRLVYSRKRLGVFNIRPSTIHRLNSPEHLLRPYYLSVLVLGYHCRIYCHGIIHRARHMLSLFGLRMWCLLSEEKMI